MENRFKIGDKVVLATDLEIGKVYNGITLTEDMVKAFHDTGMVIEDTSTFKDEQWCKMADNEFLYSVDMLEYVPNSLNDIFDKKITCVVNVSSAKQAKILYDIFYGKLSTNVFLDFVQIFNRKVGVSGYENGIAFSFYKGKPQGFCYKEWYEHREKEYGKVYNFEDLYTEERGKVKMNEYKRIKELRKQIEEINAEINKLERERDDTLEEYERSINRGYNGYTLNDYDCFVKDNYPNFNAHDYNPYRHYMTEEYAIKAAKIKKFTDMLMAFKWCYDRDYEPDWTTARPKYHIVYNYDAYPNKRYYISMSYEYRHNTIYFSSEDIAKKCVDWLNVIDPDGELIA